MYKTISSYCLKCRKKQKVKTRWLQRQIKETNAFMKMCKVL